MSRATDAYHGLSFRSKLLISYFLAFVLSISLGSVALYAIIRHAIQNDIEKQLNRATASILQTVRTATTASIRNHLRAIAENDRQLVQHFYNQYRHGELTEKEAKQAASDVLLSQTIGQTGYVYCVDSQGMMQVHPDIAMRGAIMPNSDVMLRAQRQRRAGYAEYSWANPGDAEPRRKAMYMSYFEPWDWIISVSSYRDEFKELFSIDDFRESVLSTSFGHTGHPFVMDETGILIIHPTLEGSNIIDWTDADGREFVREMCAMKNGKLIYRWMDSGEASPSERLSIFNYIPELNWIVVSSCRMDELYGPLRAFSYATLGISGLMLLLVLPVTWWISASVTRPIRELANGLEIGSGGDLSNRMDAKWGGEIGLLFRGYNAFMERLQQYSRELAASEEKHRGIFENALEGIFQSDPQGRVLSANPSMAIMLGYRTPESLMENVTDIGQQLYVEQEDRKRAIRLLLEHGSINGFETQLLRRDRSVLWVSLNVRAVKDANGDIAMLEGFVSDVSSRREAEDALRRSHLELEKKVVERTTELSRWVHELERRNEQSAHLWEMSEMLQTSRSRDDAYAVVRLFAMKFFPDSSGRIYALNERRTLLYPVVAWGTEEEGEYNIPQAECWALRQGRPYVGVPLEHQPMCMRERREEGVLCHCIPMRAQGETVGVLHIRLPGGGPDALPGESADRLESVQRLGVLIAGNLALALTNLDLRESLRVQSIQDPLTGLYNRRHMEKSLEREVARARRLGASVGVIMCDVDHFKNINDTYGHECGDDVLRELASHLRHHFRGEDVICRYGGEEFVIIMVGAAMDGALKRAEILRREVKEKLNVRCSEGYVSVTVSLGVAVHPEHGERAEDLLKAADEAMYQSKSAGRDRVSAASIDRMDGSVS
ncbi:MAG: diguanylate cyclase [Syntrophobacteraceae bacterium]